LKYRGGVMMKVDQAGSLLQEWKDPIADHDQNHLDNGELLYTTVEKLTPEQASTVVGGVPGSEAPGGKIYGDCIKHVNPATGELL